MEYDLIYLYPYAFPYVEQCKVFCKISMTRNNVSKLIKISMRRNNVSKLIKKADNWKLVKFKIVFNR